MASAPGGYGARWRGAGSAARAARRGDLDLGPLGPHLAALGP
ncbi:hypothetical protein ACWD0Z_21840 [Streptomyces sp. NPDC003007]